MSPQLFISITKVAYTFVNNTAVVIHLLENRGL